MLPAGPGCKNLQESRRILQETRRILHKNYWLWHWGRGVGLVRVARLHQLRPFLAERTDTLKLLPISRNKLGGALAAILLGILALATLPRLVQAGSDSTTLSGAGACTTGVGYSQAYASTDAVVGTMDILSPEDCGLRKMFSHWFKISGSWTYYSGTQTSYSNIQFSHPTATGSQASHGICDWSNDCSSVHTTGPVED
jgi:hypothetical protein